MAWQETMTMMLRVLIYDLESPPKYSDARLQQMLVVAANYAIMDLGFTGYTVDVVAVTISPDPSESNDLSFMNFTVLKAACLLDEAMVRSKAALNGVRAQLGSAILDVSSGTILQGYLKVWESGPCAIYQQQRKQLLFASGSAFHAILSPFVSSEFNPYTLGGSYGSDNSSRIWR